MNWFPLSVGFCFCYSGYKVWEIWPAYQTLPKALDIPSATAPVAPDLLKALAILSGATVRRSAVDWEDLKLYWKWQKGLISLGDQQSYYSQVFQRLY